MEIDLDDGVKANYPKFGTALKKIVGLDASDEWFDLTHWESAAMSIAEKIYAEVQTLPDELAIEARSVRIVVASNFPNGW